MQFTTDELTHKFETVCSSAFLLNVLEPSSHGVCLLVLKVQALHFLISQHDKLLDARLPGDFETRAARKGARARAGGGLGARSLPAVKAWCVSLPPAQAQLCWPAAGNEVKERQLLEQSQWQSCARSGHRAALRTGRTACKRRCCEKRESRVIHPRVLLQEFDWLVTVYFKVNIRTFPQQNERIYTFVQHDSCCANCRRRFSDEVKRTETEAPLQR